MSFSSKRTIASLVVGLVLGIAYIIYALGSKAPDGTDIKSWAISILVFIGIGIVTMIVLNILFHILYSIGVAVKEREKSDEEVERIIESTVMEDERDKSISLKSNQIGYTITGLGFIATLAFLAFNGAVVIGMNILFGAFFVGGLIEGIVSIYYYERGV